jgi:hypothetical protein
MSIRQEWAVIDVRRGEKLVLDRAATQAAAEALRDRYAACLEDYDGFTVECLTNRESQERLTARKAGKRQPQLPRGPVRKGG